MITPKNTGELLEIQTKVTWYVVWFPDLKEYSVVPTNWIVENNDSQSNALFCKWPPYKVTSDHLRKAISPSQSWETYRVKLVGANKTYDNFNKAWHKKIKEKYSSTDTNDSPNYKKKRFLMCPSDESDDDDGDNGLNFNIMPYKEEVSAPSISLEPINYGASSSSITNQLSAEININQEKTVHYTEMLPKIVELEYPQNHTFVKDTNCSIPISHHSPLYCNGNIRCSSQVDEKLNNIITEQKEIKLLLKRILSKLDTHSLSNNSQKSIDLNESFVCRFPMNNIEEFTSVQNCISNEFDFTSKLEYFIKIIGGNTPKNHVRRVMSKLFTDKYGIECTWTGRGKNISTKIGDSDLIKIMKKSVQESHTNTTITDSNFEKFVSEWLRNANTRYIRQKINNKHNNE